MSEWRTGRSCIYKNIVHLVFVTKYRRDALTAEMGVVLETVYRETCQQMDCALLEFGFEDDHVHLLVDVHPRLAVATLVGRLKGKSSYVLRRSFWKRIRPKLWGSAFWSPSYCVVSCGDNALGQVTRYIQDQRQPSAKSLVEDNRVVSKISG